MNSFHIDVNTTKSCNLRCTYCFEVKDEMDKNFTFKEPDSLIEFLNELLDSEWFYKKYSDVSINFWGGEPTLNKDLYEKLTQTYLHNGKVRFFLYSNGFKFNEYYLTSFKKLQEIKVNGHPKIVVQISYDGFPIHDLTRVTPMGKGSSEQVRSTIQDLKDRNIFFVMKSTISPDLFKHLYTAYLDVTKVSGVYFPTIDLHIEYEYEEEYKQYANDLYEQLIKIAAYEKGRRSSNFFWFNENRALCAAGVDMIAIDINGDIVPCHGALYTNKDEHKITNIKDKDALSRVIRSSKMFEDIYNKEPSGCKSCDNGFCLRCNIAKFEVSKKETYSERWIDHTAQPYQCYYFDIVDIVAKAKKQMGV